MMLASATIKAIGLPASRANGQRWERGVFERLQKYPSPRSSRSHSRIFELDCLHAELFRSDEVGIDVINENGTRSG